MKALLSSVSFLVWSFLWSPLSSTSAAQAPEEAASSAGTQAILRELVAPFLAKVKGQLGSAGAAEAYKEQLRVLVGEVDARAATLAAPAARPAIAREAREKLITGLAEEMGGPGVDGTGIDGTDAKAQAQRLVTSALERNREMRTTYLHSSIICWCPKENWTLTLTGCARDCANGQKNLVKQWMNEGYADEEIIDKMVAHPFGGPKVRALPAAEGANLIGYLFPFALLVLAVTLVGLVLRSLVTRRGKELTPTGSLGSGTENAGRTLGAGGTDARDTEGAGDQALDDQIEKELKEMEN